MNVLLVQSIIRPAAECGKDSNKECVTPSPWLPELPEIIYGGLASLIIFYALWRFAGPQIKKAMAARTERIQGELDASAADKSAADAEAAQIRSAKGDIAAERERLLGEADAQAAALLDDGRARLAQEMADTESKAMAEIAASKNRVGDELRAEIARLSSAAVDHVVTGSLDEATHQELIEQFISKVGARS
jgi:F-type H+-transporting ATPase subunit b